MDKRMVPASFGKFLGATASMVDRAFVRRLQSPQARAAHITHDERLRRLTGMMAAYESVPLADPSAFFPAPPKVDIAFRPVRRGVWDAAWPSAFEPFLGTLAEKYLSRVENRTARARLFLANPVDGPSKRPAVIAIHGYMGGHWLLEENAWPIKWLLRRGLDVVLPVLPQHAARGGNRRGPPAFPSSDVRFTIEGFRQSVSDVSVLIDFMRGRGAPHVGVMGMSLGGYTTALVGTVVPRVDFIMPMIPLASIADFVHEQGGLAAGEEGAREQEALHRAHWIVSPLARPPLLPSHRTLIVAAEYDRVTPMQHARQLAQHFGAELVTIPGGHLMQVGRSTGFRALATMLEREGIIEPRRRP